MTHFLYLLGFAVLVSVAFAVFFDGSMKERVIYGVKSFLQFVLVSPPVDPTLETTLDSVPGLVRVANPGESSLWRLELPTGRVQLAVAPAVRPSAPQPRHRRVPALGEKVELRCWQSPDRRRGQSGRESR